MKYSLLVNFNSSPLRKQVEDRNQISKSHFKILPHSRLHLLAVTYSGHQRKETLYDHPHIPSSSLTDFYIFWIAFFAVESAVGEIEDV